MRVEFGRRDSRHPANRSVGCGVSEKPAQATADVTAASAGNAEQARCSQRSLMYGRDRISVESVKTCINRQGEGPEVASRVFIETSLKFSSLSGVDLTLGRLVGELSSDLRQSICWTSKGRESISA